MMQQEQQQDTKHDPRRSKQGHDGDEPAPAVVAHICCNRSLGVSVREQQARAYDWAAAFEAECSVYFDPGARIAADAVAEFARECRAATVLTCDPAAVGRPELAGLRVVLV